MDEKLCDERHSVINKRLDDCEEAIDTLAKSDAVNTTQIANLTKAIGRQTTAIWGLVIAILTTLLGFFVWYVQTL